jgi:DNA-entry nuclease
MNKTTRFLSLLLAVLLLFSSCGPVGEKSHDETSTTTTITTVSTIDTTTSIPQASATTTTSTTTTATTKTPAGNTVTQENMPLYNNKPYTVISNNTPTFSAAELTTVAYEKYSPLDSLGRCGVALASCGKEIMPGANEERGSISSITPSGWKQATYDGISGGYLWNRCHLLGWQLSAENANKQNLITGTRYMNVEGMLPFENMIADYIEETNNHVAFRVTPVYQGNNLVCHGVQMEAFSIEDNGDGICFNVFCHNVQPGITIKYADGSSSKSGTGGSAVIQKTTTTKKTTTSTKAPDIGGGNTIVYKSKTGSKYHSKPNCGSMKNGTPITLDEAKGLDLGACGNCY